MAFNVPTPAYASDRRPTIDTVGTVVAKQGLSVKEYGGRGVVRQTVFTFNAMPMTIAKNTNSPYGSQKIYDFPQGRLKIHDAILNIALTTTSVILSTLNGDKDVSVGVGTAAASDKTLATTMMDLVPGSGETVVTVKSSSVINVEAAIGCKKLAAVSAAQLAAILDGTATAKDLYLNLACGTDADCDADATVTVRGSLVINWSNGGLAEA